MENLFKCTSCKAEFPFERMRYTNTNRLVCMTCYTATTPSMGKRTTPSLQPSSQIKSVAKPSPSKPIIPPPATRYRCWQCQYKFTIKKGSRVKQTCPYCGSTRVSEDITSSQVLKDVADLTLE
ncbi:hypothetical protein HYW21_08910 [Candidatus Woesearchaeota archaeon]|nr:hypothetical protein [Candidatus Woesearchaeota archaeon]